MSLYSRYSESSISVSYFSRSSALIGWDVLLLGALRRITTSSRMRRLGSHPAVVDTPGEYLACLREGVAGQAQPQLLADVTPGSAVLGTGSEPLQRRGVLGCVVALVGRETIPRMAAVQIHHDAVPGDLGEDTGRRDTGRGGVAADHRQRRHGQAGHPEAVGEHVAGPLPQTGHRPAHALDIGHVDADGVDLPG